MILASVFLQLMLLCDNRLQAVKLRCLSMALRFGLWSAYNILQMIDCSR